MTANLEFSVIIPTYNRKDLLRECLRTVNCQKYQPSEIIVVDDGSTDGTINWLENQYPEIRVILQENCGPGIARNRGARIANGDYLAFLDSDDLWFPWTLSTFAELIERYAHPSLLFGKYVDFQIPEELEQIQQLSSVSDNFATFLHSHPKGYFCGAGMMVISREAFEKTPGFAEDFLNAEDHDLALHLGAAKGFVQVISPITVGHRIHGGNEMNNIERTLAGLERLVTKEKEARYAGGSEGRSIRRKIIARHVRPAVIGAMRSSHAAAAWGLYRSTFVWNLRLGRIGYLVAAPLLSIWHRLRRDS